MRRLLVFCVVLTALVLTGSAMASYTPHLVVVQAGTQTKIHLTIPKADDATAALVIYSPTTATATLTQAIGTQIGTVEAQVNAKAISPALKSQPKEGKISGFDFYRDPLNADRPQQSPEEIMQKEIANKSGVDAVRDITRSCGSRLG